MHLSVMIGLLYYFNYELMTFLQFNKPWMENSVKTFML